MTTDLRLTSSALGALAARYEGLRSARWAPVPAELDMAIAADAELAEAARRARRHLVAKLARRFEFPPLHLATILDVPRERFVLPEDIAASADDTPLPLDRAGDATVSAPHAYLLTYDLLGLTVGDSLIELGTGTGYGAALARRIVGPGGRVLSIEIDASLFERAARLLGAAAAADAPADRASQRHSIAASAHDAGVTLLRGDGRSLAAEVLGGRLVHGLERPWKVAVTYALSTPPVALEALLPEGGLLVAPVGAPDGPQELLRVERRSGPLRREAHGAVRYVSERSRA